MKYTIRYPETGYIQTPDGDTRHYSLDEVMEEIGRYTFPSYMETGYKALLERGIVIRFSYRDGVTQTIVPSIVEPVPVEGENLRDTIDMLILHWANMYGWAIQPPKNDGETYTYYKEKRGSKALRLRKYAEGSMWEMLELKDEKEWVYHSKYTSVTNALETEKKGLPEMEKVEKPDPIIGETNPDLYAETSQFPNGFISWMETHHEIVESLTDRREAHGSNINKLYEQQGRGALYELGEKWTNMFEAVHAGNDWSGDDFYLTLDRLTEKWEKELTDEVAE